MRGWIEPVLRAGKVLALHLRKDTALQVSAVVRHARALGRQAQPQPVARPLGQLGPRIAIPGRLGVRHVLGLDILIGLAAGQRGLEA